MGVGKYYVPRADAPPNTVKTYKNRNKNPEKYREYQRRLMRERRAKAKEANEQSS